MRLPVTAEKRRRQIAKYDAKDAAQVSQ